MDDTPDDTWQKAHERTQGTTQESMPSRMLASEDFDDADVYDRALRSVCDSNSLNFVVEFGKEKARIKTNVGSTDLETILKEDGQLRQYAPVRWINVWSPDRQRATIKAIADHYHFSARLTAILTTPPPPRPTEPDEILPKRSFSRAARQTEKEDVEIGSGQSFTVDDGVGDEENHYSIADHLKNYASVDIGPQFLCIGANWMHQLPRNKDETADEVHRVRLWTWLVICDDATVLSIHEPLSLDNPDPGTLKVVRSHTLSVLAQLSQKGYSQKMSLGLISVRQNMRTNDSLQEQRHEGSSNLFYYLFDSWKSTYQILRLYQDRLELISKEILLGTADKTNKPETIISRLYRIGQEIHTQEHLHRGYENLVARILEFKPKEFSASNDKRLTIALPACERFERLSDRIRLLVLSSLGEALQEKDALVDTYFNITAQRDSQATARLTLNSALLSKLGILFLPVSLMTSYFSIQVSELDGVYTAKDYWGAFGVVVALSILAVFVINSWLVSTLQKIENYVKGLFGLVVGSPRSSREDFPSQRRNAMAHGRRR